MSHVSSASYCVLASIRNLPLGMDLRQCAWQAATGFATLLQLAWTDVSDSPMTEALPKIDG